MNFPEDPYLVCKTTLGLNILPSFLKGAEIKPGIKKAPCKRVIFLYMRGGMSQTDTFDLRKKGMSVVKVNLRRHKVRSSAIRSIT